MEQTLVNSDTGDARELLWKSFEERTGLTFSNIQAATVEEVGKLAEEKGFPLSERMQIKTIFAAKKKAAECKSVYDRL